MPSYIEKGKALQSIERYCNPAGCTNITPDDVYQTALATIEWESTADLVEVVRCKDCKFNVANMEKGPLDITDYSGDDIVCSYIMTDGLKPNDYCSYGEPKKKCTDGG